MAPARVNTPNGKVYFIPEDGEIGNIEAFNFPSKEILNQLAFNKFIGTRKGFKITTPETTMEN